MVGPLDRVKILFQASNPQFAKYSGSWFGAGQAMRDIYRADGVLGLFRGHQATLLRIFPYAAVKFLAYEQVRAILIPDRGSETAGRRFASGALAGCASVCATYPLEVIRVRMAWETKRPPGPVGGTGPAGAESSAVGLVQICRRIFGEGRGNLVAGVASFYRGFTPTIWGMLPYAGSSFLAHDVAGDVLRAPRWAPHALLDSSDDGLGRHGKPPPLRLWAELAAGGFAGFVSQTVSYPLEVIRRRMQVGGVVGDGHRLRMSEVAMSIWRQSSWQGFFVGLTIGYAKVVPMVATSFFVYERTKFYMGI